MNLVKIDLQKNRLKQLIDKLNRKSWNPVFITLVALLVAIPAAGFVAGKKFAQKKNKEAEIIKIAEFKEKEEQKDQTADTDKSLSGNQSHEEKTPTVPKTPEKQQKQKKQVASKPKIVKVVIFSPHKELFDGICAKTEEKVERERIEITRIIALETKDCSYAKAVARKLKKKAPFLDPWVKHKGKYCVVIAGSYSVRENVIDALNYLRKHGYHPKTERLYRSKEKKLTVCYVEESRVKELEELLSRHNLRFNYAPGNGNLGRNAG